jgi:hypothetical protein
MSSHPTTPFASPPPERAGFNLVPWAIAGLVVLIVVGALVFTGHSKPAPPANAILPLDPYAPSLAISSPQMSESTSLSGGKSTYIDGHVKNTGDKTVTAATVQVLFANDMALPPQIETLPLTLIRTHEPYVDTQPISAAPLAPGDEREFRLIFEDLNSNWNQQLPQIHVTHVTTR